MNTDSDASTERSSSADPLDGAGNGRLLGGQFSSGSSGTLVAPVAARLHHGSGLARNHVTLTDDDMDELAPEATSVALYAHGPDQPPAYHLARQDDDEGISMEDHDHEHNPLHSHSVNNTESLWARDGFHSLDNHDDDDNSSNQAVHADDEQYNNTMDEDSDLYQDDEHHNALEHRRQTSPAVSNDHDPDDIRQSVEVETMQED
jgi:hypothetical protein